MPIGVVFGMYLPLNVVPAVHQRILDAWPHSLIFLRTPTFWQWYLTIGLLTSFAASARRACRHESLHPPSLGAWRLDAGQEPHPPHTPPRRRSGQVATQRRAA